MSVLDEVGAALTGLLRGNAHRGPIENRENEPWPGWMPRAKESEQALPQTVHPDVVTEDLLRRYGRLPEGPPDKMASEAGADDIHQPTQEELLQYLLYVDYLNSAQGRQETEQFSPWLAQHEIEQGLSPQAVERPPLPKARPKGR